MKFLKYFLGFLIIIIIAFFAVGLFVPTFSYQSSVKVDAPVEKVWEVFVDESKLPYWMDGFQSIETISGKRNEVGSIYELVFLQGGEEIKLTETLKAFEPGKLFAMKIESDFLSSDTKVNFEQEGDQTIITAVNRVEGNNLFKKSICFLSKSTFQEMSTKQYTKLKDIIENE
ncbi:SRPBCC family protein [Fulvivirgaceae bacterium BMA10]|uniref:SRPBCC family protein n=1 Tax=Splendidivirga corallicola TaxID=3051826 RepID=A0ABT8KIV3_9BACT|nr:SRPBCC family protein [Fulvivirgaceae bacterium BMA10]